MEGNANLKQHQHSVAKSALASLRASERKNLVAYLSAQVVDKNNREKHSFPSHHHSVAVAVAAAAEHSVILITDWIECNWEGHLNNLQDKQSLIRTRQTVESMCVDWSEY